MNNSKDDPKEIGLSNDADLNNLCSGDPINGDDSGKCVSGDTGNYCYDVHWSKASKPLY